jgi:hypothetical protein
MRPLTAKEIEALIEEDRIVWVSCRSPAMPLLQGKFVKSSQPMDDSDQTYYYCFCPYKRGQNLPFLPASHWLIKDDEGKKATDHAIKDVMKLFKK